MAKRQHTTELPKEARSLTLDDIQALGETLNRIGFQLRIDIVPRELVADPLLEKPKRKRKPAKESR